MNTTNCPQMYLQTQSRYTAISKLLEQSTKNKRLYLDAGCGKGDNILTTPDNVERVGIDILRSSIKLSKQTKNDSYIVADLTTLPFKEGTFDGVLCFDVLEHINDKAAVLDEFRRVTKQGGFFVGCTTNILNPVLWFDTKLPWLAKPIVKRFYYSTEYERHGCRLTPRALYKTLTSSEYLLDSFTLVGVPPFDIKKFPIFLRLWIHWDMLLANRFSYYLKEMMLWRAIRR